MKFYAVLISFLLFPISLIATEKSPDEIDSRYVYLYSTYTVNKDATHVENHEWAVKILKERAVKQAKSTSISYSKSVQTAKILKAYTIKADGKHIDAPKTNYQIRENSGTNKNAPVFSDRVTITVVFPEVEVGDTIVFSYEITQTKALFPNQFTTSGSFSYSYPYDDVKVTLDLPESFHGRYSVREMAEKITIKNGRKIIELSFSNKKPIESKRRNYSIWDFESQPGYIYTTFKSYQEIAKDYGKRATPKAKVTDRVKNLAIKIIGDVKDKREQARLMYEWVSKNITYGGNCIGVGAVVPHNIDFVLDNKMGDCKDHATLLQALLNSQNIKNTQALVNSGSLFKLPSLPIVSAVNHVMNYISEFDIFVDATSKEMPFGMLPLSTTGKPVLLVDNYVDGLKSPIPSANSNQQKMITVVNINADGTATGNIEVTQKGMFAVISRTRMRYITKKQEEEWIKNIFTNNGQIGSGTLDKEDPKDLIDSYSYKVKFNTKGFLVRPGAGAFYIHPLFPNEAPVARFISGVIGVLPKVDVACSTGLTIEEYIYHFPKGIKLLSIPDNLEIDSEYLKYSAIYELDGNTLNVVRRVDDLSPANICTPEVLKSQRKVGLQAIKNLKAQVIYK